MNRRPGGRTRRAVVSGLASPLSPVRWLVRRWRASLQVRVVTGTLLLSAFVVAVAGWMMVEQVTAGLLESRKTASKQEASRGIVAARERIDSADPEDHPTDLLTRLTDDLHRRGSGYDVIVAMNPGPSQPNAPLLYGTRVQMSSVPDEVLTQITPGELAIAYTVIHRTDGTDLPGLAIGSMLRDTRSGATFAVYYLFDYTPEAGTIELLRQSLIAVGVLLVVLLGAVAWFVTRQVVTPVRMAREVAERLAAGLLDERLTVHGRDDLARLAMSFNQMAASLQRQIRQLEELSRVQRRFVSDVSHELRTPLTTVRMAADLLYEARPDFTAGAARSAELLQTELNRFEALLSDLLEISRYDAGAAVLDPSDVDLRSLVTTVVDGAESLAARKGCRIRLELQPEPCEAEIDPRRIERVIRNLVQNAVEYGEGRDIRIRVAGDADAAAVTVRDHGIGLKPGESAMVFERFWRSDPARARTTGGTGLGLAIAMEDVILHGGWLQAWGEPGNGSQFRMTLPRHVGGPLGHSPLHLVPDNRLVRMSVEASAAASGDGQPDDIDDVANLDDVDGAAVDHGDGAADSENVASRDDHASGDEDGREEDGDDGGATNDAADPVRFPAGRSR